MTILRFNKQTRSSSKMEETARLFHEAMLSQLEVVRTWRLLWASLNKEKGLKSAETQLKNR